MGSAMQQILTSKLENDDGTARVLSEKQRNALINAIVTVADEFLAGHSGFVPASNQRELESYIQDFFVLYDNRPIRDNTGGTKFNDSLWLYLLARLYQPKLIIESGTHKGHSAWLFRQACPSAEIHCFDITLDHLVHRESDIDYHAMDWSEFEIKAESAEESLCYFDDHTNQARRVREAYERGFRTLLFDDNRSAATLYGTGGAPVPTINMLFDESLEFGETIEWQRHGKSYQYVFRAEDTYDAKDLIEGYAVTSDLAQITRYNPQSGITIVRLVP